MPERMRYARYFRKTKVEPRISDAHHGTNTSVYQQSFGKAHVNCCLRGGKSLWVKSEDKNIGVLQLFITTRQEEGHKLLELVLELSFSEHNPTIGQDQQSIAGSTALVILEPPCPGYLKGKPVVQQTSSEVLAQPQVSANAISVSGMGTKTTSNQEIERAWRFQGEWSSNDAGVYTNAVWTFKAVAANPDIEDVGRLYAGVIIQHPGRPFYITCKASGKLVNWKNRLLFSSDRKPPNYACVHPYDSQVSVQKKVEELAKDLESEIEQLIEGAAAKVLGSKE